MPDRKAPLISPEDAVTELHQLAPKGTTLYVILRHRTNAHTVLDPFVITSAYRWDGTPDLVPIRAATAALLSKLLDLDRGGIYTTYTSTNPERRLAEDLGRILYDDANALKGWGI